MNWIIFLTIPLLATSKPEFDYSAAMKDILVPADAAVGSVIYRLRASDPFFDYPLVFNILDQTSVVKMENLNCSRLNSVCQANIILKRHLDSGRFYDFTVEVRNQRGIANELKCSFHATNATTPIEKIFPGAPSLLMVSESARRNTELGTILAKGNPLKSKPVLLELWGSPEFGIHQKLVSDRDAHGTVILLKPLDYEKRTTYHLTVLANDPWTNTEEDTRNIMGWSILIAVIDEQDTPPIFTIAPPTTTLSANLDVGDLILRVHAEDGDKGNPREIRYGLLPDGTPLVNIFSINEVSGEIRLAQPLSEIFSISHTGQPILVKVVAEEVRTNMDETPSQSTTIQLAFIPPSPISNKSAIFGATEYITLLDENSAPGTTLELAQANVNVELGQTLSLKLENNNDTFIITPTMLERSSNFKIIVKDPALLDYERRKSVQCYIIAQQLNSGNYTSRTKLTVILNDVNDNPPKFSQEEYHGSVFEHSSVGTNVILVEASDVDSGLGGKIKYTKLSGKGSDLFKIDTDSGLITVENSQKLDAEITQMFVLTVEAADEYGKGFTATATVLIDIIDINDQKPEFEKSIYEFYVNNERNDFTFPAYIKAIDNDVSPPNNQVHYEVIGIPENLYLNKETGEILVTKTWTDTELISLKAMAWDGGVPSLFDKCEIRIYPPESKSQKLFFIVPGRNPNKRLIEDTLKSVINGDIYLEKITPYESEDKSVVEVTITSIDQQVYDVNGINKMLNNKLQDGYTSGYTKEEKIVIRESSTSNLIPLLILFFILMILALIILLLCCLYKSCPCYSYFVSRKIKSSDSREAMVKTQVAGSGLGKESKSVQAAEWFNRKEAWTADHFQEDAPTVRNIDRAKTPPDATRYDLHHQRHLQQDARDHMYIREGNADILRLITREGVQQQSVPLAANLQYAGIHSGKDMIMQHFMEQQVDKSEFLPNTLTQLQSERELIQESLREQNALLRQLLIDRDLRLETQSLPACTQTDHDIGTQIEPEDLYLPRREIQTDNDQSDVSDEEIAIVRAKARKRNGRKSNIHKRIRTPIEEEVELKKSHKESSFEEKPMFKHTKTSELRQKRASSNKKLNELRSSKLGLRKEVLQEIAESLEFNRRSDSDLGSRKKIAKQNSSSEDSSHSNGFNNLRYYSESDLTLLASQLRPELWRKEMIQSNNTTDNETKRKPKMSKRKNRGVSRYMEWYNSKQKNSKQNSASTSEERKVERTTKELLAVKKTYPGEQNNQSMYYFPEEHTSENKFERHAKEADDNDSGIVLSKPQIANKKSVFTIAYDGMQTKQIRPSSTFSQ